MLSPLEASPYLPSIPVVGASIILIGRLERELAFNEAFKDRLGSHLSFQLCKRMEEEGKKQNKNLRIKKSNLESAEERKSIWNLNRNPKGKAHEKAIL